MLRQKPKSLTLCEVLHEVPGRVRIGCRALRYLPEQSEEIRARLGNASGVRSVRVTPITGNVLVHFCTNATSVENIRETTETVISSYAILAHKAERFARNQPTVQERRLHEESISEMIVRLGVTSAALLFSVLRPGGPGFGGPLIGRFTTMPAMTSISLAVPILKSGWHSLRTRMRPNADTLSATAILASLFAGRATSALTIIWLADLAELLTAYTMERARQAIRDMLSVGEEHVWRVEDDGTARKVPLESIREGDRVQVHTGEKISVDGVVEGGDAAVDQSSITGEFMPVRKLSGDEVFAGTVLKSGRLTARAQKVGDATAVARIVHLVEEASQQKASIQAFADRFSAGLIPLNFTLAILVYALTRSASRALNMLIIDYSCGVRLSTATAFAAAICTSARNHVLVKGSNYIEMLAEADTIILDKTGTLTEGRPQVTNIIPLNGEVEARNVVELAAAAEETSTHPMAVAILDRVRRSGWRIPQHRDDQVYVARGVETVVDGGTVRVGNRQFMAENGIDVAVAQDAVSRLVRQGENVVYVAHGTELRGVVGIQDSLRENMKKALNRMRLLGMDDIILLTGDVEQHAEIVASRMAMDRYEAEVLPEDKAQTVLQLQSKGVRVIMAGDGINDAPALAYADVGIAMGGTRTDIAMEAADITIAGDEPLTIPSVIQMAQKTMSIVRQNFATAIGVNSIGLVLGALGVLPVLWAAVLHNASTVAVVLNSARLLVDDIERGP